MRWLTGIGGITCSTRRWGDRLADIFGAITDLQGRLWNFLGKKLLTSQCPVLIGH